jgi:hypothetical protein
LLVVVLVVNKMMVVMLEVVEVQVDLELVQGMV